MKDVQAIIIRVVIYLAIVQITKSAPRHAENIAETQSLENGLLSSRMTEEEREERDVAPLHSVEKRHSQKFYVPPMFSQNCNKIYNLGFGESAVFFSEDGIDRRRCRYRFKSPKGTKINIECPIFNLNKEGCKMESFTINERGRKKKTFCKRNRPPVAHGKSNRITVAYRRSKNLKDTKNRGYICRAFVITQDPPTTSTTTSVSPAPSTFYSWVTPSTTAISSTSSSSTSSSSLSSSTRPTTIIPTIIPLIPIIPTTVNVTTILPLIPITIIPITTRAPVEHGK